MDLTLPKPRNNRRPTSVADLLFRGEVTDTFSLDYRNKNRFFLVNLDYVLSALGVETSKCQEYFNPVENIIDKETGWSRELKFTYKANQVQINKTKRSQAKYFGTAVAIIVAMEQAAAAINPAFNVYDHLRILSAQYFVDKFNLAQFDRLFTYYKGLTYAEKARLFPGKPIDQSLEDVILEAIEQQGQQGLLKELAGGCCATFFTCEKLVGFINEHFPSEYHVGPIRPSGDPDRADLKLGDLNTASLLRVKKRFAPNELPPCPRARD